MKKMHQYLIGYIEMEKLYLDRISELQPNSETSKKEIKKQFQQEIIANNVSMIPPEFPNSSELNELKKRIYRT